MTLGASFLCACTSVQNSSRSGAMVVRCTTNAQGRIVTVAIIQSAGSAELDQAAVTLIQKTWHGPANASKEFTLGYTLSSAGSSWGLTLRSSEPKLRSVR